MYAHQMMARKYMGEPTSHLCSHWWVDWVVEAYKYNWWCWLVDLRWCVCCPRHRWCPSLWNHLSSSSPMCLLLFPEGSLVVLDAGKSQRQGPSLIYWIMSLWSIAFDPDVIPISEAAVSIALFSASAFVSNNECQWPWYRFTRCPSWDCFL